jgi:hypothetical protein
MMTSTLEFKNIQLDYNKFDLNIYNSLLTQNSYITTSKVLSDIFLKNKTIYNETIGVITRVYTQDKKNKHQDPTITEKLSLSILEGIINMNSTHRFFSDIIIPPNCHINLGYFALKQNILSLLNAGINMVIFGGSIVTKTTKYPICDIIEPIKEKNENNNSIDLKIFVDRFIKQNNNLSVIYFSHFGYQQQYDTFIKYNNINSSCLKVESFDNDGYYIDQKSNVVIDYINLIEDKTQYIYKLIDILYSIDKILEYTNNLKYLEFNINHDNNSPTKNMIYNLTKKMGFDTEIKENKIVIQSIKLEIESIKSPI